MTIIGDGHHSVEQVVMLVIEMIMVLPQTVRHSHGERVSWMCLQSPVLRVEEVVQCVLQWSSMESPSLTERAPFKLMQHMLTQQNKLVNSSFMLSSEFHTLRYRGGLGGFLPQPIARAYSYM